MWGPLVGGSVLGFGGVPVDADVVGVVLELVVVFGGGSAAAFGGAHEGGAGFGFGVCAGCEGPGCFAEDVVVLRVGVAVGACGFDVQGVHHVAVDCGGGVAGGAFALHDAAVGSPVGVF